MRPVFVAVGASKGGLVALRELLAALPAGFSLPIAIAQHRARDGQGGLVELLQSSCALPVRDAEDKDRIVPGTVYLAPPDYHLLLDGQRFALSTEAPVSGSRPSIDVLFLSAAEAYRDGAVAVVLTGMGSDGANGARAIKQRGGRVLVQGPESAECRQMPDAALASTSVDRVLAPAALGAALAELAGRR